MYMAGTRKSHVVGVDPAGGQEAGILAPDDPGTQNAHSHDLAWLGGAWSKPVMRPVRRGTVSPGEEDRVPFLRWRWRSSSVRQSKRLIIAVSPVQVRPPLHLSSPRTVHEKGAASWLPPMSGRRSRWLARNASTVTTSPGRTGVTTRTGSS